MSAASRRRRSGAEHAGATRRPERVVVGDRVGDDDGPSATGPPRHGHGGQREGRAAQARHHQRLVDLELADVGPGEHDGGAERAGLDQVEAGSDRGIEVVPPPAVDDRGGRQLARPFEVSGAHRLVQTDPRRRRARRGHRSHLPLHPTCQPADGARQDNVSPVLGIVVVSFGSASLLRANLTGLPRTAMRTPSTVVVVDNFRGSSAREAVRAVSDEHGWELIENATNAGFGTAVNTGVARAVALGCTSVVIVNPDAAVDAHVLDELAEQVAATPRTLVSPRVLRPDGRPWFTGGRIDLRAGRTRNIEAPATPQTQGWLSGACLAAGTAWWQRARRVRRRLLPLLGGRRPLLPVHPRGRFAAGAPGPRGAARRRRDPGADGGRPGEVVDVLLLQLPQPAPVRGPAPGAARRRTVAASPSPPTPGPCCCEAAAGSCCGRGARSGAVVRGSCSGTLLAVRALLTGRRREVGA